MKRCTGGRDDCSACAAASDCSSGVCYGYYTMKLKAYGDASRAAAEMQREISGGGHAWGRPSGLGATRQQLATRQEERVP